MSTLQVAATRENLQTVLDFVHAELDKGSCPVKIRMQLDLVVEEVFVNIANYAYGDGKGPATVSCAVLEDKPGIRLQFIDQGMAFNPLAHRDPDTTLPAADRQIGGLGILLVKKLMDKLTYMRAEAGNILTLEKYF